jgi:four helix bundle protein
MSRNHERLEAFKVADHLATLVYRVTRAFPRDERFGLTSQLRRAAVSIPTNIVEGSARRTHREYVQFINVALGSAAETLYLIQLAQRLELVTIGNLEDCETCARRTVQILQKLLNALTDLP